MLQEMNTMSGSVKIERGTTGATRVNFTRRTFAKGRPLKVLLAASLAMAGGCSLSIAPPVIGLRPPDFYAPYYGPPQVVVQAAQPQVDVEPPTVVAEPSAPVASAQADPALQQLVAPIALYPDPILADVLPASTYPDQVQQANQFVQSNPNASPADIDSQAWDPSIKALAHYPSVLGYMASQPDWVQSLGSAFCENQANVFEAIQDLRAQARNNGNLNSLVYLDVVADGPTISIQPADPATIYFPVYDPVLVYQGAYSITYGPSYDVGPWLEQGVDWDGGVVFVGDWHGGWLYGTDGWRRDHYFHGYDHRWGHDDRFGRRPYVDRAHWANRSEMREHGGLRAVARTAERTSHIRAQNQRAQVRNADIRNRSQASRNQLARSQASNAQAPRTQGSHNQPRAGQNPGGKPQEQAQKVAKK